MRYLLERLDEAQILEIDRLADVPNCGVTSYEFDPAAGSHGKLVPPARELRLAAARGRRPGDLRAGRAGGAEAVMAARAPMPALDVDTALLRGWPLPQPDPDGDKETRGRVLVIAGSREMPGAALLAATAALRAGAGRLTVATADGIAPGVALALPESARDRAAGTAGRRTAAPTASMRSRPCCARRRRC